MLNIIYFFSFPKKHKVFLMAHLRTHFVFFQENIKEEKIHIIAECLVKLIQIYKNFLAKM